MPNQSPVLVMNPSTDPAFVSVAEAEVAVGVDDPSELQRRLRARYPDAVVRARDLTSERWVIWYVYRDGRWMPDEPAAGS